MPYIFSLHSRYFQRIYPNAKRSETGKYIKTSFIGIPGKCSGWGHLTNFAKDSPLIFLSWGCIEVKRHG